MLRRPGAVQVGFDSPHAILIATSETGLARWLQLLDGTRGTADLQRSAARMGLGHDDCQRVLDRLAAADLLSTESDAAATVGAQVRLIGAGRLGRAIALSLVSADLAAVELIDDDPVDQTLYSRYRGLGRQAMALHAELTVERTRTSGGEHHRSVPARAPRITAGPPWSAISIATTGDSAARRHLTPDVTVLASDRLEVDRMFTDALLRADQPHLLVRGTGDGVVVGPLVLPGRTPCLRCTDLLRCELDPDWPALLSQLCRTTGTPSASLLGWAAGITVIQVLTVLNALENPSRTWPETLGATLELGRDGIQRRRSWPRHPACGCGWTTTEAPAATVVDDAPQQEAG